MANITLDGECIFNTSFIASTSPIATPLIASHTLGPFSIIPFIKPPNMYSGILSVSLRPSNHALVASPALANASLILLTTLMIFSFCVIQSFVAETTDIIQVVNIFTASTTILFSVNHLSKLYMILPIIDVKSKTSILNALKIPFNTWNAIFKPLFIDVVTICMIENKPLNVSDNLRILSSFSVTLRIDSVNLLIFSIIIYKSTPVIPSNTSVHPFLIAVKTLVIA